MSEQKKWIIGVLLAVLALCYFRYQRHHQAKLDEFRSFVMGDRGKNSGFRCLKRHELGLSQSEMAKIIQEVQAERDFDNSK